MRLNAGGDMVLRTYQPKKRQRLKEHGFRKRMRSAAGKKVLRRRRLKQKEHRHRERRGR